MSRSSAERSPRADIGAEMLTWARDLAAWSVEEAAHAVGVSAARWRQWESGAAAPTMTQLRTLAEAVRQPLGVFFLPSPPPAPRPVVAFRRLLGTASASPEIVREARRAIARREVALELADEVDVPRSSDLLSLELTSTHEPELAATALRAALGVTLEDQRAGTKSGLALWRDAVERQMVLVFETRALDVGDARGFCLPERPLPVIVLNGKDAPSARCFTLLHECVHVVLGESSVCNDGERGDEPFCDRVAAAALLPRDAIRADAAGRPARSRWTDPELKRLAARYGVSEQALLLRLVSLRLARRDEYDSRKAGFRARRARDTTGGAIPQHTLALKYAGHLYPRIVLDALGREAVTYTEVARHLDIGAQHLAKLESALHGPGR